MNYSECKVCPRECGINRSDNDRGICGETHELRIASACLHFGEEPALVGKGGSGTIFITGCNLGCSFCQNYQISQHGMGRVVLQDEFVQICLALQKKGAQNINIVTGSHVIPALAAYLQAAKSAKLTIPVCWNSSAYETLEALKIIAPVVDIWLPDLKTRNPLMSGALFAAPDYPEVAQAAIRFMVDYTPLHFQDSGSDDEEDQLLRGVIVRHLFLPGRLDDTISVFEWLKTHVDGNAGISIMTQYTPINPPNDSQKKDHKKNLPTCSDIEEFNAFENRFVDKYDESDLRDLVDTYAFEYMFFQELENSSEWLPDFNRTQPFLSKLATPVWHWTCGFVK
jgi:putative pyruvate formate lyase activating enzyme